MTRRTQENVIAGLLVAVFAVYLLMTLSLGPNARLVPVPIALLGLGFLLIQIVSQNRSDGKEFQLDLLASLTAGVASTETETKTETGDGDGESSVEETLPTFQRELQAPRLPGGVHRPGSAPRAHRGGVPVHLRVLPRNTPFRAAQGRDCGRPLHIDAVPAVRGRIAVADVSRSARAAIRGTLSPGAMRFGPRSN